MRKLMISIVIGLMALSAAACGSGTNSSGAPLESPAGGGLESPAGGGLESPSGGGLESPSDMLPSESPASS